jgi:hypothetical protein
LRRYIEETIMSDTSNNSPDPATEETKPDETTNEASETGAAEKEKAKLPVAGHIHEVGMLDLRSAKTPEDLSGITAISEVGCILIPEHLAARLNQIPMSEVGSVVPIPQGENIKCQIGQVWLTGEALAAGDPEATLMIIGQAFLKTPVTSVGYKAIRVHGQLIAIRGSEGALGAKISEMQGQTLYLPADSRTFMGDETIRAEFLELLPAPQCLVVMGKLTFEDDVTVELLKAKVPEIVLMGEIVAPSALIPLLQVLTVEKMGEIKARA